MPLLLAAGSWVSANPQILATTQEQIAKLKTLRASTALGVLETLTVLRGNVDHLADSADDEEEARRAQE